MRRLRLRWPNSTGLGGRFGPDQAADLDQTGRPNSPECALREDTLLRDLFEGVIRDNEALDPDIFDLGRVNTALTEHVAGHANHWESLALMATFGEWHRRYGPPGRNLP